MKAGRTQRNISLLWFSLSHMILTCTHKLKPAANFLSSAIGKEFTIRQLFPTSSKQRWDYSVLYGKNGNQNLATCSSKFESKVLSCIEQTANHPVSL